MDTRSKRRRIAALVLWSLWLLALLATPYVLYGSESQPYLASPYAYVAVGLLLGFACARWLDRRALSGSSRLVMGSVAASGSVLSALLVVPEWAAVWSVSRLGLWGGSLLAGVPVFGPVLQLADSCIEATDGFPYLTLMTLCSAACSFSGFQLGGSALRADDGEQRLRIAIVAVMFLLGSSMPGFWTPYAEFAGSMADSSVWQTIGVAGALLVPTWVKFIVAVVEIALCIGTLGGGRGCAALLAFASGEVSWNLVSRCVKVEPFFYAVCEPLGVFVLVLEVLIAVLLLVGFCLHGKRSLASRSLARGEDGAIETDSCNEKMPDAPGFCIDATKLDALFETWGLAPSERGACRLMLEGKTSQEAADELGLKPSTVRNYLQRSYRKAQVADAGEFKQRLEEDGAWSPQRKSTCDATAEEPVQAGGARGTKGRFLVNLSLWDLLGSLCLFCSPVHVRSFVEAWGTCHSLAIGLGLGAVLAAFVLLLGRPFPPKKRGGLIFFGALVLTFFVAGVLLAACLWLLDSRSRVGAAVLLIGTCVAASACAASVAVLFRGPLLRLYSGCASNSLSLCFAVVAIEFALSCFDARAWLLLEIIDLLAFVWSSTVMFLHDSGSLENVMPQEGRGHPAIGPHRGIEPFLVLVASFAGGLVLEELVRSADKLFFLGIQGVYCLGVIGVCLVPIAKARGFRFRADAVTVVALLAIAALGRPLDAFFLASLDALVRAMGFGRFIRSFGAESVVPVALGVGTGLLIGRFLTDRWYSFLLWDSSVLELYGSGQFMLVFVPAALAVLVFAGLAVLMLVVQIANLPDSPESESGAEERKLLYLASQGLSDHEAKTASKIAQGYTGFQISYLTHYSLGSINTWRGSAYRKLGVHSKAELVVLLEAQVK